MRFDLREEIVLGRGVFIFCSMSGPSMVRVAAAHEP